MVVYTFPAGSTVELQSGGMLMTVETNVDGIVQCMWFDKTGRLRRDAFPVETLTHSNGIKHDGHLMIVGLNATEEEARERLREYGNA